jgi:hypothetical protein
MFPNELFWKQDENCHGFVISTNPQCTLRTDELSLVMYTPEQCTDGTIDNCADLVTYVRL